MGGGPKRVPRQRVMVCCCWLWLLLLLVCGGGGVVVVVVVVGLLLFGVICYCCLLQLRAGRATQGAPRTSRRLREGPPTGETKTPESRNRGT